MKVNGSRPGRGANARRQIAGQPACWRETLDRGDGFLPDLCRLAEAEGEAGLLLIGSGSSLFLAMTGAALFQELTGRPARAVPAGDVLLAPHTVLARGRRYLVVALSRSGETSETVAAVRRLRDGGHPTVALTGGPDSGLARTAAHPVVLPGAGGEGFGTGTQLLLLLQMWAAALAGRAGMRQELEELPAAADAGLEQWEEAARELAGDPGCRHLIYLGAGSLHGLAGAAALAAQELSGEPAAAWHTLEFRRGPMAAVTLPAMAVLLTSRRTGRHEADLMADLDRLGVRTVAVGEGVTGLRAGTAVELGTGLSDWAGALLHLVPAQFLALHRALALGKDPDARVPA